MVIAGGLDPSLKQIVGMDFGYVNDPSTIIQSMIDLENNVIWIYDEFYKHGCTNDTLAVILKQKGLSKSVIIADCAEEKSIAEIKAKGIRRIKPCTKGKGSINAGIDKLLQFKLIVHSDCENVQTELENYAWKKDKKTGEYINEPIDEYNHCIDALRYSLQCIEAKKLRTFNKSLLRL